jgi:GT2 family glycosyltransferase
VPATVDIVVPVYRGEAETRACLGSVLAAGTRTAREVIVIDDASPEPALREWLRNLAKDGRITLIAHEANRGFVATANEGMALHPARDVVLLNSDTEVAPGWLDRLAACAASDPSIGTATPFSNNATVCSYPRTLQANALPAGETAASLDAAFAAANPGRSADIPTAVGFCMYVARRCIAAVGSFDEARYGAGYGEEVDFCMRAARAGFRHVIAADVFVRHVGEVSFGNTGSERRERAQALVDRLYPEFQPRLRAFIDADPLRALRRQADLERLRHSAMPRRLFLRDAPGADSVAGAQAILLRPHGEAYVELRWCNPGEEFAAWFHLATEWNRLAQVLGAMGAVELRPGGAPSDAGLEAGTLRLYPPEPAQAAGPAGSPAADPWAGRAAAAEERVRTLEASRSWRITAPLRAIGRWLRPRA